MSKLLIVLFVLAVIIAGPFLLVWSMNTLFPVLAIPYTLDTWFAALILGGAVKATVKQ